ncbi:hypothetical protein Tco_0133757 [Tanacetum coccineum]
MMSLQCFNMKKCVKNMFQQSTEVANPTSSLIYSYRSHYTELSTSEWDIPNSYFKPETNLLLLPQHLSPSNDRELIYGKNSELISSNTTSSSLFSNSETSDYFLQSFADEDRS